MVLQCRFNEAAHHCREGLAFTRENDLGLSARELQIPDQLASGMTNAEISSRLHRSVRTVEHHVSQVRAKAGAKTRAELRRFSGK